jgi:hypothetical protein
MSDKCTHNNHTHFMLWFFVWGLCLNSCLDCSGEQTVLKNRVSILESRISDLESDLKTLKKERPYRINDGRLQEIPPLQRQREELEQLKQDFYGKK